ncbi:hypothetical protein [Paenibacillus kribbensis]|uniref:hypothetical protein n=1 Tax=Paenibacillus kribbensis TaxID=172713 RepID=UPI0008392A5C|nr:hypothetical protein [Paenibacillus kribbensis]
MRVKPRTWGVAFLVFSAITFAVVITNSVFASSDTSGELESVTKATIPANVLEELYHPDKISTKDGLFVKTKTLQVENRFSQNEVVYDVSEATDKTKVIVAYDATYIKEEGIE